MANQEQLDILKQGMAVWNKWREENPSIGVDLREANLTGVNLTEADFKVLLNVVPTPPLPLLDCLT